MQSLYYHFPRFNFRLQKILQNQVDMFLMHLDFTFFFLALQHFWR